MKTFTSGTSTTTALILVFGVITLVLSIFFLTKGITADSLLTVSEPETQEPEKIYYNEIINCCNKVAENDYNFTNQHCISNPTILRNKSKWFTCTCSQTCSEYEHSPDTFSENSRTKDIVICKKREYKNEIFETNMNVKICKKQ